MGQDGELQLVHRTLDVLVLKTLSWGPRHGYAIARWIRATAEDEILVEDRSLYVALHRLEEHGWMESEWGVTEKNRRAKFYRLTEAGRVELRRASQRWERYAQVVSRILAAQSA